MADQSQKAEKNVPGAFYVDTSCIDCSLCYTSVPNCFARDTTSGSAYVQKQPNDSTEFAQCNEALENCPVQAIGNDG